MADTSSPSPTPPSVHEMIERAYRRGQPETKADTLSLGVLTTSVLLIGVSAFVDRTKPIGIGISGIELSIEWRFLGAGLVLALLYWSSKLLIQHSFNQTLVRRGIGESTYEIFARYLLRSLELQHRIIRERRLREIDLKNGTDEYTRLQAQLDRLHEETNQVLFFDLYDSSVELTDRSLEEIESDIADTRRQLDDLLKTKDENSRQTWEDSQQVWRAIQRTEAEFKRIRRLVSFRRTLEVIIPLLCALLAVTVFAYAVGGSWGMW